MSQIPHVFISYSHSSEDHKKSIIEFASRLISDGIQVTLDTWDLKAGHNLHKFMESMITSQDITKVLIILDDEYQKKADLGSGGVGVESEIVSSHIYKQANQEKFIPIVWSRDENGDPFLPVFLKSRTFIDLSNATQVDEYSNLLRAIYDKPQFIKPALGTMPLFLEDEGVPTVPSSFYKIKEKIRTGDIGKEKYAIKNFFYDLGDSVGALFIKESSEPPTDDQVFEKIETFSPLIIEYDNIISNLLESAEGDIYRYLRDFFELCLSKYQFNGVGRYFLTQFSAIHFVAQEILLHTIAVFLKNEKFEELQRFFNSGFIVMLNGKKQMGCVFDFYEYISILEQVRNKRLNLNRISLTADLLKERASSKAVTFEDIAQADLVLYLRAVFTGNHWNPKSIVYSDLWNSFDLFLRSESKVFFLKFCKVIGVDNEVEFFKKWDLNKDSLNKLNNGWRAFDLKRLCNYSKITSML